MSNITARPLSSFMEADFPRMFRERYARRLFLIWVPVIFFCIYLAFTYYRISPLVILLSFIGSYIYWTFLEYLIHRFIFHWQPQAPLWKKLFEGFIYKLHAAHHEDPMIKNTFMWPSLTVAVGVLSYLFLLLIQFPEGYREILVAGVAAGYLSYETAHHGSHQWKANSRLWKFIKRHHALHHYKDPKKNYGVTTSLWDHVFGTYLPDPKHIRT